MKKAASWFPQLPWSQLLNTKLILDVGAYQTRVVYQRKLIWHQPTCLTYHAPSQSVLEIGQKALQAFGKTPKSVQVIFPVQNGQVSDVVITQQYLRAVLKAVLDKLELPFSLSSSVVLGVPASSSPVALQMWTRVLHESGFQGVKLIKKSQAVYEYVQTQGQALPYTWLLDIGSQMTEVAVFSGKEIISSESFEFGGHHYTTELQDLLRSEYQVTLGYLLCEQLKMQQRGLHFQPEYRSASHKTTVRVTDILSNEPKIVYLERNKVEEVWEKVSQDLVLALEGFLGRLSPDIVSLIQDQGLYLTGGGSQLNGLSEYLHQSLTTQVTVAKQPELEVVWGLATLADKK